MMNVRLPLNEITLGLICRKVYCENAGSVRALVDSVNEERTRCAASSGVSTRHAYVDHIVYKQ
ncbi:hypothetical protein SAMN04488693_1393 [Arthrobacter subterraneus]|uniref:Uncharacterized protein n=1 Tax=Arthrobacter subterraneus TaxID=335973 RepID=A0A1G8PXC9_9MICC|nr:hypothetical protein SAMN04488693_1393 [Arthrobacter subterraneus]